MRMTDDGKGREPEIERYGAEVIGVHWLFIIFLIPMLYTGLLMWRDWFTHEFHIYGIDYLFPSFEGMESIHVYTGLIVLAVGGAHLLAHWGQKEKHILPKNVGVDVAASVQAIFYIFHLSPKPERGAGEKYLRNQRMTYIALVYVVALCGITAIPLWLDWVNEMTEIMHILAGLLLVFLSGYRILYLIRIHDTVAMRSILATGTMPEWYVKKHHFLWYKQVKGGYKAPNDPQYEKLVPPADESGEGVDG
jgi:cytochrome b subunit of formate dehydrogenase